MNGRAARRASRKHANPSRHAHPHPPSREELQRQVERQQHEIERLQEQVAERDQKIADAEKQIADSEKQIADAENRSRIWNGNWQHAKRILLTLPNHHPPMDWPGSRGSAGGE